jgi:hypothetical protein
VTATGKQPQVGLGDAFEQRQLPQQMLHGGGIIDVRVAWPVTGDRLGQVDTAGLRDVGMPNVPAHTPVVSGPSGVAPRWLADHILVVPRDVLDAEWLLYVKDLEVPRCGAAVRHEGDAAGVR